MSKLSQNLDVRNILLGVNGLVVLLMLITYPMFQHGRYVNGVSFLLGLTLALMVHLGLSKRGKGVDPFVVILFYYVTTYYTLRVVTLAVFDFSDVFPRFAYGPQDTNYALAFIIACSACMFCGFSLMRKQAALPKNSLLGLGDARKVEVCFRSILLVLFLSVMATVTGAFDAISDQFRILRVLIFFLRPTALIVLAGAYLVVFWRGISKSYLVVYFSLVLLLEIELVLEGSRGHVVYLIETLLLLLVANETFRISRKWLYRGLMLMPLLLFVLSIVYVFATLQRSSHDEAMGVKMTAIGDAFRDMKVPAHIASRVGFLDMSAEIISHKSNYGQIFTGSYYAKSFVDNLLTPGFDCYDAPKIAYALIFKHQSLNRGEPSKAYLLENNIYHSDQLNIYGEMYALFGWCSLPILFAFSFLLKWGYYNLWVFRNRYKEVVKRVVILIFFVNLINSFGFDWIIVQTFPFVLTAGFLIIYLGKVASKELHEASV